MWRELKQVLLEDAMQEALVKNAVVFTNIAFERKQSLCFTELSLWTACPQRQRPPKT